MWWKRELLHNVRIAFQCSQATEFLGEPCNDEAALKRPLGCERQLSNVHLPQWKSASQIPWNICELTDEGNISPDIDLKMRNFLRWALFCRSMGHIFFNIHSKSERVEKHDEVMIQRNMIQQARRVNSWNVMSICIPFTRPASFPIFQRKYSKECLHVLMTSVVGEDFCSWPT